MSIRRKFAALVSGLLLLSCNSLTAFAEVALPDGAVKGLPERLAALDDEGNAVNSATGEYFFRVEDMDYGVTYTKEIQLMNLRDDASYYIYFYTEPLYKEGTIDLEKGCECTFYLDGEEFYRGDVNGHGNIDLTESYKNCGFYAPGDSHVLKAEVVWNDLDVLVNVDNGHRLVDVDGEHVLRGSDESGHVEGEIEFKWIFFASIVPVDVDIDIETTTAPSTDVKSNAETTAVTDDNFTDVNSTSDSSSSAEKITTTTNPPGGLFNTPFTGYLGKDGKLWLAAMGVISGLIALMLVLIYFKKKKEKDEN